ncbi:carcinoembryonic antigen-related cell adhesion molecule 3 [Podarcis lilfordi]|uniref:Carcinoembryonic antigen-related cell adhesion molecule 3 n=2 Tax=Podarcis lilfordi TaxID=74358 RepID=A0AA35KP44_9SAUR|nr:carcinoembryonic antigen-related cell adhesion molecule 3 [Podarcis lilfordi]
MSKPLPSPRGAGTSCGQCPQVGSSCGHGRSGAMVLLAGHILSSCFLLTQAVQNITIDVSLDPEFPLVGQDVTFVPKGLMIDVISCLWTKGEKDESFPIFLYHPPPKAAFYPKAAYDGRQTPSFDCSMHIRNVTFDDIGLYEIFKTRKIANEVGEAFLLVTEEKTPELRKPRSLTSGAIAGLAFGCIVGAILLGVMLISLLTMLPSTSDESDPTVVTIMPSTARSMGSNRPSHARMENQLILSSHNVRPG